MKAPVAILGTIVIFLFCSTSYSQEKTESSEHGHQMEATSIKELDGFHELLHPLVHEAYPNKDFATIKKALPGLIEAANSMKNATLPKEFVAKKDAYVKGSKKLIKQLTDLNRKKAKFSDEEFGKKFMDMHDTFESIMDMTH